MTFAQLIQKALAHAREKQDESIEGAAKREYALAITALEEAQMRFTRGFAIDHGRLNSTDLELVVEEEERLERLDTPEG